MIELSGYKSFRNKELGSWFMRDLITVMAENVHQEHLADMLTKVNYIFSPPMLMARWALMHHHLSVTRHCVNLHCVVFLFILFFTAKN